MSMVSSESWVSAIWVAISSAWRLGSDPSMATSIFLNMVDRWEWWYLMWDQRVFRCLKSVT